MAETDAQVTNPLFNQNKLKLATFCTNNTAFLPLDAAGWEPVWSERLEAARQADAAGFEAIVPIARWKGYVDGKPDHLSHIVFDPFTYAAAIAQATNYSAIFSTTHAPTVHPLTLAKQAATIDHISGGRYALNIVGGWNRREFEMFGIELLDHDERYEYLDEWLSVVRRLWSDANEFDHDGRFLHLKGAISRPRPLQRPSIPIMNAGLSETGRRFAARNADIAMITLSAHADPDKWREQVSAYKKLALDNYGKQLQVWSNTIVVQRDTQEEAEEYLHEYSVRNLDNETLDSMIDGFAAEANIEKGSPQYHFMRNHNAVGSGYLVVGTAETIAGQFKAFADAGLDGVLMNYTDPVDGVVRFSRDVVPRLEQMGLRARRPLV